MDIIDRLGANIEVTKMIQKEAMRAKAKECLNDLAKVVATFNSNID